MLHDMISGWRTAVKQPLTSLGAVVALAIALGTNGTIFSLAEAVLVRALPVRDIGTLVLVRPARRATSERGLVSTTEYLEWRRRVQTISDIGAFTPSVVTLTAWVEPVRASMWRVTPNVFGMLGVSPIRGRDFMPGDQEAGATPTVLLSHRLWQQAFGGDASVLGRTVEVDRQPYQVIGIMPRDFAFPVGADLWAPFVVGATQAARDNRSLLTVGRLAGGQSVSAARTEMSVVAAQLSKERHESDQEWSIQVTPLFSGILGDQARTLVLLLLGIGLIVLGVACVNLAGLLLARILARRREVAVRCALGAGRATIVRQLTLETLPLSLTAAVLAVFVTLWATDFLEGAFGQAVPVLLLAQVSWTVVAAIVILACLTPLIFGLLPAWYGTRLDIAQTLRESRDQGSARALRLVQRGLVSLEVALGVALVAVAGLLVSSARSLGDVPLGFEPANVLTFRLNLARDQYGTPGKMAQFYDQLTARLATVPGVAYAAVTTRLPVAGGATGTTPVTIEGRAPDPTQAPWALQFAVSADYFRALEIPVLAGRSFEQTRASGAPVALVSQTMAAKYWPAGSSPVGARFKLGKDAAAPWLTVVGVVGDVRNDDADEAPAPLVYVPFDQAPGRNAIVVLRSQRSPAPSIPALKAAARELDANLPIYDVRSMTQVLLDDLAPVRLLASLVTFSALTALVLAFIGVFAIMSWSMAQRAGETAVRLALGAQPRQIRRLVARELAAVVAIGVIIGEAGAFVIGPALSSMLYGVAPRDPLVFAVASLVAVAAAAVASIGPFRRVTSIEPVRLLRAE